MQHEPFPWWPMIGVTVAVGCMWWVILKYGGRSLVRLFGLG